MNWGGAALVEPAGNDGGGDGGGRRRGRHIMESAGWANPSRLMGFRERRKGPSMGGFERNSTQHVIAEASRSLTFEHR